jgi:hypothetical protein
MKIMRREILLSRGQFPASQVWIDTLQEIENAILAVEWPPDSGSFTLFDESGKRRGEGNGVTPIKKNCMEHLRSAGWELESRLDIATVSRAGPIDAAKRIGHGYFCVEWETGNISSSHRAMNKMALGILQGILVGGILILPTRKMYNYLTDRVGNLTELEPYFPLWRSIRVVEGLLGVIAIEQDAVSKDVPPIPKGTSGRALE